MGRTLSEVKASGATRVLPARAAIAAGDLLVVSEGGAVRPARGKLGLDNQPQVPAVIVPLTGLTARSQSVANSSTSRAKVSAVLGSGNFAFAGAGGSDLKKVVVEIKTPGGALVGAAVTVVTEASNVSGVMLCRMSATQFVVAWQIASGTYTPRFAILNNDGSVAVAAADLSLSVMYGYGAGCLAMTATTDGHVVIAYRTTGGWYGKRFNGSGVLQGAEFTVSEYAATSFIALAPASGNGFVAFLQNNSQWFHVRRFSSAGTQVQNVQASPYASGDFVGDKGSSVVMLDNGEIGVAAPTAANTVKVTVLTPGGASYSVDSLPLIGLEAPQLVADGSSALWLLGHSATTPSKVRLVRLMRAGAGLYKSVDLDVGGAAITASPGNSACSGVHAYATGTGRLVIVRDICNNAGPVYETRVLVVDATGGAVHGVEYVLFSGGARFTEMYSAFDPVTGTLALTGCASVSPYYVEMYLQVQETAIVGVATAAAAAGADVTIETVGKFTINQTFTDDGAFSRADNQAPGNQGVIVGNAAYLMGV